MPSAAGAIFADRRLANGVPGKTGGRYPADFHGRTQEQFSELETFRTDRVLVLQYDELGFVPKPDRGDCEPPPPKTWNFRLSGGNHTNVR